MDKLRSLITYMKKLKWKADFQHSCTKFGNDINIQGPIICFGGGTIEVGNNFVARATQHLPVEIFVASNAFLEVGNAVFLNQGVRISCSKKISIGDNCLIADECVLLDNDFHASNGKPGKMDQITLESGVWLATRVIVLRGVTIGRGSCIGAGSVVTRSIPPGCFAAGAPARVIRSI